MPSSTAIKLKDLGTGLKIAQCLIESIAFRLSTWVEDNCQQRKNQR